MSGHLSMVLQDIIRILQELARILHDLSRILHDLSRILRDLSRILHEPARMYDPGRILNNLEYMILTESYNVITNLYAYIKW